MACKLLALLAVLMISGYAFASDDKLVEKIEFKGKYSVANDEIARQVKTKVGDKYLHEAIIADFERILATKLFDEFKSSVVTKPGENGGVIVVFILVDKPRK